MYLDLTDEQRAVREMARKFADEYIVPVARDNDINERFPGDIIEKMGELGLLGGPVPLEYGGAGLDYISQALVTEEIGKACSSVRTTISVQISLVELSLASWGTEDQKRRYLPALCSGKLIGCFGLTEPNAGSDPSGMETSAVADGDHWVLNGHKIWISNGGVAGLAIVFAQTDKSKGNRGIGAFLVDRGTPGFSTPRHARQARPARLQYRASSSSKTAASPRIRCWARWGRALKSPCPPWTMVAIASRQGASVSARGARMRQCGMPRSANSSVEPLGVSNWSRI